MAKKFFDTREKDPLERTIQELEMALDRIRGHFMFSERVEFEARVALNQDALAHSDKLEPDSSSFETLENLLEAWKRTSKSFDGIIDTHLILKVAQGVDSHNMHYRTDSARMLGIDSDVIYMGNNPVKIARDMDKIVFRANNSDISIVRRAAEFNLYSLQVHPFDDGNGRTFRLIQNLMLHHAKYPPVIIRHTDRVTYLRHIEDAKDGLKERLSFGQDFYDGLSFGEVRFFEYMVDRIKESTDRIERKVGNIRRYDIILSTDRSFHKGTLRGAKTCVDRALKAHGRYAQLRINNKERKIRVVSDASLECLAGIMHTHYKNVGGIKDYSVNHLDS